MGVVGAVFGAAMAIGLIVTILGVRGVPPHLSRYRRRREAGGSRVLVRAAAAFAAAVAVFAVTGWPVGALLAAAAAVTVPATLQRSRRERDALERTEAVAAWTEMVRDTVAAASGLEEALAATAPVAPEPIRSEIQRLARRLPHGRLDEVLLRLADELANPAADLVIAALVTTTRHGGRDLAPLLSALAASARGEAEMRRRIHVSRARIRTSARVVTGTLLTFAALLLVFNRDYLAAYDSAVGQLVLLVVGVTFAVGWWWLQRMADIRPPPRLLRATDGGE